MPEQPSRRSPKNSIRFHALLFSPSLCALFRGLLSSFHLDAPPGFEAAFSLPSLSATIRKGPSRSVFDRAAMWYDAGSLPQVQARSVARRGERERGIVACWENRNSTDTYYLLYCVGKNASSSSCPPPPFRSSSQMQGMGGGSSAV